MNKLPKKYGAYCWRALAAARPIAKNPSTLPPSGRARCIKEGSHGYKAGEIYCFEACRHQNSGWEVVSILPNGYGTDCPSTWVFLRTPEVDQFSLSFQMV